MAVIQAGGNLEDETTEEDDEETKDEEIKDEDTKDEDTGGGGPLPGQLTQTATPQQIVANQLANLLAPAQTQGTSAQQLLDQLNARRGR
jgi:hypothetical protein